MKINYYNLLLLSIGIVFLISSCKKKETTPTYSDPDTSLDIHWSSTFESAKSVNGPVYAIAVNGSDVFVGGTFTMAGTITTSFISKWDTLQKKWFSLSSGVNDGSNVKAIAVDGQYVYIGGAFSKIGGVTATNIARWDTVSKTFSTLGTGVNGPVSSIAVNGGIIYVGGSFVTAGGITVNNVAKYDTTTTNWTSLGGGINGSVSSLAFRGNGLYVGGYFITAGDVAANNVGRWYGNSWTGLGNASANGVTGGTVMGVTTNGTEVYVGGNFSNAGGKPADLVAQWTGSGWASMPSSGDGLGGDGFSSCVNAITMYGTSVYVGGSIVAAGNVKTNNIAKWDGGWFVLGSGASDGAVRALSSNGTDLWVGGDFKTMGGKQSCYIAHWK
ncbi:MAG: hypothetical protein HXX09_09225 [Bacteroidetes bacterium]|nr:hypothetical protein [Bacteroidota bacterium]